MGLRTIGSWISRTRSGPSRTCSTRTPSPGYACSTPDRADGRCTGCRWAATTNHVHVWKSLLERAGFTLEDIPKEWEAFWSFWCDQVQPAVRKATGRDDIWGVGLAMSGERRRHRQSQFVQFVAAYEADYVTRDGRAGDRRSGGQAQAHQGHRQLHRDLSQGLHAARLGDMGPIATTTSRSWPRRSS